jgi:acetylornithine deacetylase/succinyl-diaminopimelate desuccinylase-like protein
MLDHVLAYLQAERDRILGELVEFASIPSVSTDPAYAAQVGEAARWVEAQLTRARMENVQVVATARHPVVYGDWLHAPGAPTVLVYGHYDVQPPDPLDKWHSDPFAPTVRDGRLYGRGVSDDKGPMLIPLKVAEAFTAVAGALPLNVKFLFEGEEEIGSPSLEQFVAEHDALLAADFALSADGAMWRTDEPSITVSSRGIAGLEFTVTAAAKDLHSGRHGGAVANPLHAIAALVASLHTLEGRVAVEGFYDDVVELSAEERAALAALPFDEAAYAAQTGIPAPFGEAGYSTLERQWVRPTLEINGMWGGYQGAGSKTVIPAEAHAKVTCRLVAQQNPADIAGKVARHLELHTPPGVRLTIHGEPHNALPYAIPDDHPGLAVAENVLLDVYGQTPARVRMGGTLPVSELFLRILDIYTVFFSFSTADEDFHAPNEFFRVRRLHEGLEAWAKYWARLGAMQ